MDLEEIVQSTIPENLKQISVIKLFSTALAEILSKNSQISIKIRRIFDIDDSGYYRKDDAGNLEYVPDVKNVPRDIDYYANVFNDVKTVEFIDAVNDLELTSTKFETIDDIKAYIEENPSSETTIAKVAEYICSNYIIECRNTLKNGLFGTYLSTMSSLINDMCGNAEIIDLVNKRNLGGSSKLVQEPYDFLNSEFLGAFRYFEQSSGTEQAIRYIYQFSRYLETGKMDNTLDLETGAPFFMGYKAELHSSVFENFNHPMAHLCGWCYFYETIASLFLQDYYGINFVYEVEQATVICGRKRVYFGPVPDGVADVKDLKENEISTINDVFKITDKVHIISANSSPKNGVIELTFKKVKFDGGETIISFGNNSLMSTTNGQFGSSLSVVFGPSNYISDKSKFEEAEESGKANAYHIFDEGTILNPLNIISTSYEFEYYDIMEMEEELIAHGGDSPYYITDNYNAAFQLVGITYPFFTGVDESLHIVNNASNILSKFTLNVIFTSINMTNFCFKDEAGNVRAYTCENGSMIRLNTHGMSGDWMTLTVRDGKAYNYDHYVKFNFLNKPDSTIRVTGLSTLNYKISFKVTNTTSSAFTVRVTVRGQTVVSETFEGSTATVSASTLSYDPQSIYTITVSNGTDTVMIEGNGVNANNPSFSIGLPYYPSAPTVYPEFTKCTPTSMAGISVSGKPNIYTLNGGLPGCGKKNGLIVDDPTYTTPQGEYHISELDHTNYENGCYINRGYTVDSTESWDTYSATSTKYIDDDFYIESSGYTTWLKFKNDDTDGSKAKYLVCRYGQDDQSDIVRSLLRGNTLMFQG